MYWHFTYPPCELCQSFTVAFAPKPTSCQEKSTGTAEFILDYRLDIYISLYYCVHNKLLIFQLSVFGKHLSLIKHFAHFFFFDDFLNCHCNSNFLNKTFKALNATIRDGRFQASNRRSINMIAFLFCIRIFFFGFWVNQIKLLFIRNKKFE